MGSPVSSPGTCTSLPSRSWVSNWGKRSVALDLNHTNFSRDSIGFAYDNSCLTFSVAYNEARGVDIPTRTLMFNLLLRTLGDSSINADVSKFK